MAYPQTEVKTCNNEVIYHIFQRSFFDSNGDFNGDFNGIREKLPYLEDLGVTAILLTPIFESPFYHNYFSGNFEKTDPKYGTKQEFINLVKAIHQKQMKVYLDMETQYVTEDHVWFKDSFNNTKSPYSKYILYNDRANKVPESIIYGITQLTGYDGTVKRMATVNLYSRKVREYNYKLFKSLVDPNDDRKFNGGVDGFRLDHMMDDLDNKGRLKKLFNVFWGPLFSKLKKVNPKLKFIAEQANWASYGYEYFKKGRVDRVFAFNLQKAIISFDKTQIIDAANATINLTPAGKQQIVFLENHDTERIASALNNDAGKLRVAAAINLLISDLVSIYYGQELGMTGTGGFNKYGLTDGNDIPQREAFEWYQSDHGPGMALWYKDTGPWWGETNLIPDNGISLEEEKADPNSLWHFYRDLLHLRKNNTTLATGKYENLPNNNDHIFSFSRIKKQCAVAVLVNLSDMEQEISINTYSVKTTSVLNKIYGVINLQIDGKGNISGALPPFGVVVLDIKL